MSPLGGGGDRHVLDERAAVEGRLQVLAPGRRPGDRSIELAGGEQGDELLGVEDLSAEPAADVGSDHA